MEISDQFDSKREKSPGFDTVRVVRLIVFLDSTGGAAWPFSVGRVICLACSATPGEVYQMDRCLSLSLMMFGRSSFVQAIV